MQSNTFNVFLYLQLIMQLRFLVQIFDRFCDLADVQVNATKCPDALRDGLSYIGLRESQNTFNKLWEILLLAVLLWHRYKVFVSNRNFHAHFQ